MKMTNVNCNGYAEKFLCEVVEVVEHYEDDSATVKDEKVDVKATFFAHLGDYGEENSLIRGRKFLCSQLEIFQGKRT